MQLVMMRSDGSWTAWSGSPITSSNPLRYTIWGTSASVTGATVQFSDRINEKLGEEGCVLPWARPWAPSFEEVCQNFNIDNADSWNINVTQDGVITIVNNTWGGTTVIAGTCAGTNGQIFGTVDNTAVMLSLSP